MPPKPQNRDAFELFQSHFDPAGGGLNPAHELIQLAQKIDWDRFEAAFAGAHCPDLGAPAKATRLMVGLQYLKFTFNESGESVVDRRVENPYGQYFCRYTHLQHQCPIHPTSMSRWRKRVEADRLVCASVTDAYVDKGYRGHGCAHTVNVHLPGPRSGAGFRAERRRRRRRSAIEPKIGHLKPALSREGSDHGMDRSLRGSGRGFLAGLAGDAINPPEGGPPGRTLRRSGHASASSCGGLPLR